jgi:hypothetical protein
MCYDLVTLFISGIVCRFFAIQRLVLLEGWQTTFVAILLFSLTFRLRFYSVQPDLINVLIVTRLEISSCAPPVFPSGWPIAQTAPPTTEEEAAEEEEDPGGDSEPDGVADWGLTTSTIDPGFCQEKEGKVEDEGEHSDGCGKTWDASATACGGDFSDMREETEDSRTCGQGECDDVENKAVCYPFNNYIGDLNLGVVPE